MPNDTPPLFSSDDLTALNAKIDHLQSTVEARFSTIEQGFPNGDPVDHRRYHDALIERIKARSEFWKKLTFELAKWGLLGFLGWVALQLWPAFLRGPK